MRWTNLLLSGLGTIWVVWWLTRREFGEVAASVACLFAAVEPNLLAAASLGTADAIAVPPTLLAMGFYVDYRRGGSIWKLLATGLMLGLGWGFKVSMLLQGGILLVVVAFLIRPRVDNSGKFSLKDILLLVLHSVMQLAAIVSIALLVSWAINGFYNDALINPVSENNMARRLAAKLGLNGADTQALIGRMRQLKIPGPLAVFRSQFVHSMYGHVMTFRGVSGMRGPWYYYPYIFLMKIHIVLLAAVFGSLAVPSVRRSPLAWSALLLLLLSCTVKIHGGTRYFDLFLALLTPLGGAAISALLTKLPGRVTRTVVAVLLLGCTVGLTARSLPELLTHTSPLWGGDAEGYRYADANYDWNQGLYYARHIAQQRGLKPIHFITECNSLYGIDEPGLVLQKRTLDETLDAMDGNYIAVAVHSLYHAGLGGSELQPLAPALVRLEPDGRLTNSFFYFDFRDPSRMAALKRILAEIGPSEVPPASPK